MDINVLTKFMQNARVRSNEYLKAIKVINRLCLFVINDKILDNSDNAEENKQC